MKMAFPIIVVRDDIFVNFTFTTARFACIELLLLALPAPGELDKLATK